MTGSLVPLVDLTAPADRVVAAIDAACRDVGFFAVTGHGVPDGLADAAWDAAREFFDLPRDEKMEVAFPSPGYPYGYSPVAYETLAASLGDGGLPDLKESLAVGPDCLGPPPPSTDPGEAWIRSASRWPRRPAGLRDAWSSYFVEMSALAARLLGLMARALALADDHFAPLIDRHTSAMRALRYPALAEPPPPGQPRAGAHTDYGTLTILRTDSVSGLQIRSPDRSWSPVPSVPGGFVVNLGDSMAQWTNDHWRSTLHRVVVDLDEHGAAPERQSFAFFHMANWDARIECLPSCREPGRPPRHEPVLAGPWLMRKFQRSVDVELAASDG